MTTYNSIQTFPSSYHYSPTTFSQHQVRTFTDKSTQHIDPLSIPHKLNFQGHQKNSKHSFRKRDAYTQVQLPVATSDSNIYQIITSPLDPIPYTAFKGYVYSLAFDRVGSRFLQNVITNIIAGKASWRNVPTKSRLSDFDNVFTELTCEVDNARLELQGTLLQNEQNIVTVQSCSSSKVVVLLTHPFANYVMQRIFEIGHPLYLHRVVLSLKGFLLQLACNKHAPNSCSALLTILIAQLLLILRMKCSDLFLIIC